jgi:hypothetical protein
VTARDNAANAGQAAAAILAAAQRAVLAAMAREAASAIRGTIPPPLARKRFAGDAAVELGRASAALRDVYARAVRDATGKDGPLPDAPGQVATAILRAQQDADTAFGAVLAAALGPGNGTRMPPSSSPYRRIVTSARRQGAHGKAAAAVLDAIEARGLTGYVSPAGRRQPLAAYGQRAVRTATAQLARMPVMSEITARRGALLAQHTAAVGAAWKQAAAGLDAGTAVAAFRGDVRVTSAAGSPQVAKRWRKEAADSAALILLSHIWRTAGYAALLRSLESMARDGIAEGEADAMAMAAHAQRLGAFRIADAFTAAAARLKDDMAVTRMAQEAAENLARGVAADIARVLASAAADASESEIAAGADSFLSGDDVPAVARWTEEMLWSAYGAGAVALWQRAAAGNLAGATVLIDWNVDSSPCAICQENADGSPYLPYEVPPMPQHPRCRCWYSSDVRLPVSVLAPFLAQAA